MQHNHQFHLFIADLSPEPQPITSSKCKITVLTSKNLGYAHGVNVCLSAALKRGFTKFVVANNDTYVERDFVDNVTKSLAEHPQSVIGGKIYYAPGYEYHKDRYNLYELGKVLWYAGGIVDWDHVITHHRGVDEIDLHKYDALEKTDFITGCMIGFDKEVVDKIGMWDESYFLYYEDADYCERAKRKKIPLYYDPTLVMWHKNAQSTEGSGSALHQKYQNENRLRFGLKYAPLRTKLHLLKNYAADVISKKSNIDIRHWLSQKST
jgi:GT2 family glycosyltransferase